LKVGGVKKENELDDRIDVECELGRRSARYVNNR
jgi:hypothetical protein